MTPLLSTAGETAPPLRPLPGPLRRRILLGAASAAAVVAALAAIWPPPAPAAPAEDPPAAGAGAGAGTGSSVNAAGAVVRARTPEDAAKASASCLQCHRGIEEIHPQEKLGCADCHGGDPAAAAKEKAHVQPKSPVPNDERVLPLEYDLPYQRFLNPANLRVADAACGACHGEDLKRLKRSLHGTTAGHLCDGLYENGVTQARGSLYSIFPVSDDSPKLPFMALKSLVQIPAPGSGPPRAIQTHYQDVVRKNCMRCHLWSRGTGLRGRLGQDGDYRSEGCASCHVPYADDGLSKSGDPTVDKFQPGHPTKHRFVAAPSTTTCVHCHYGDASIGLNYRGLSQLPPGMPAGPEIPGTTPARLNGVFYVKNPRVNPPDVHYERGMHCVDCHTYNDTMGDGHIYGQMEHAVEITCADCHGTLRGPSRLTTSRGNPLRNLRREGERVLLKGKLDGKDHVVKQVADIVNPKHSDYNPAAAAAMTPAHLKDKGGLACYACHTSWTPNFFGFSFDRNEAFTQLDLLSGERTIGRVNTQEKVFSTWKGFYLGYDSKGFIAPYLVGFSTVTTAHDKQGKLLIDQAMPRTAAGLSGMTLIHHQPHTVRGESRLCVECHRNPAALGLGSENFRMAKEFAFATSARGVEVVAIDKKNVEKSTPVATLVAPGARAVAVECDPITAHARLAVVACGTNGVVVADLSRPVFPRQLARIPTSDARDVVVAAGWAFVADGVEGVKVLDLAVPARASVVAQVKTRDARRVRVQGYLLFVADGEGGLAILDVSDPLEPKRVGTFVPVAAAGDDPVSVVDVALHFSASAPDPDSDTGRTPARNVAFLAAGTAGVRAVDVTNPARPRLIGELDFRRRQEAAGSDAKAIAFRSVFDLGTEGGQVPSEENDYLYLSVDRTRPNEQTVGSLICIHVTDPTALRVPGAMDGKVRLPPGGKRIDLLTVYQVPNLAYLCVVSGPAGGILVDVTKAQTPMIVDRLPLRDPEAVAAEEMRLDQLLDVSGRPLKDISHEGARFFTREEMVRILKASLDSIDTKK
ncbi:MAG: hypothetical protein HYZ53_16450 [Planctomycetes bacterium]|nr:hypothetical protein [Planctomycetota bacterium]